MVLPMQAGTGRGRITFASQAEGLGCESQGVWLSTDMKAAHRDLTAVPMLQ